MLLLRFSIRYLNDRLYIRFTLPVFRERLSVCVCASSAFDSEGGDVEFDCSIFSSLPFFLLFRRTMERSALILV